MLVIQESFFSIQGEGRRAGYNSLFIRFGGCNFKCAGFGVPYTTPDGEQKFGCDSFYAVDQKFKKEWIVKDNYIDIVTECNKRIPLEASKYDVVITGGEPLIYWNNVEFQNLIAYYISREHKVTIETNASLDIEFTKDYQKQIQFSMSVKLENSGEAKHKRINIDSITNILENTKQSYLKFVVAKKNSDGTMNEIREILDSLSCYADVFLMPLGDTNEVLNENRVSVAELCIEHNFMYSDRMHIAIWGNKMGV